jgi:hypothetical protein
MSSAIYNDSDALQMWLTQWAAANPDAMGNYKRSGRAHKNYNRKTKLERASALLIQEFSAVRIQEAFDKFGITVESIIKTHNDIRNDPKATPSARSAACKELRHYQAIGAAAALSIQKEIDAAPGGGPDEDKPPLQMTPATDDPFDMVPPKACND